MIIDGEEGITHINMYSKSLLDEGKWLSNFTLEPIIIDNILFNSIEGYWYYLLTNDLRLCKLSGNSAKQLGKELISNKNIVINDEFKNKIKIAIDIKLKSNLAMVKRIININLPIAHYYVNENNKRIDADCDWLIEHIEFRIKQLKSYFNETNVLELINL